LTEALLTESNQLLQDAISKLSKGEVESAISSINEARNKLAVGFSLTTIGPNEYNVLRQIIRLIQCAMLHYFALAKRDRAKENNALTLAYLGYALGINITLDSMLLPLMGKHPEREDNRNEILWLSKLNNKVRETLCKSTMQVMNEIKGKEKAEHMKDVDRSVAKIIDSVDPNAAGLRELAIKLGRLFEAGDFKQARSIFQFVRDEIQYIYDPMGLEEIQSPETTLKLRGGDCEDQAILLSSLLSAIGFESALIFADTNNNGVPDHVYSTVYIPNAPDYTKPFKSKQLNDGKNLHDWIPLDPASQDSDFGVIPIQDLQIVKLIPVPLQKK
jgi:hypothetical protein